MPAKIPGTTKLLHSLAVAIPNAVVGPPMLAFDAKIRVSDRSEIVFPIQGLQQDGRSLEQKQT